MESLAQLKPEIRVPQGGPLRVRHELAKLGPGQLRDYYRCAAMHPANRCVHPSLFVIAAILMIAGAWLLASEEHAHFHIHVPVVHEHRHTWTDEFHRHKETDERVGRSHSHEHAHRLTEHEHGHMPDIHHRHGQEEEK